MKTNNKKILSKLKEARLILSKLKEARFILSDIENWCQRKFSIPTSRGTKRFCAIGVLKYVSKGSMWLELGLENTLTDHYRINVISINDNKDYYKAYFKILELYNLAIQRLENKR